MHTITKFGREYNEGGRCPACSGSRDTGGRLVMKRRVNVFLKCAKCRYAVHSERVVINQIKRASGRHDRNAGINAKHF